MAGEPAERITFPEAKPARALFGEQGSHLKLIEQELGLRIHSRGATLNLEGDPLDISLAKRVLTELYELVKEGYPIYAQDVDYAIRILSSGEKVHLKEIFLDTVYVTAHKRVITPKSLAQKQYIETIRERDIVFGIGPAGTGKTYLAMSMAVAELTEGRVNRIILARPAVEAGEKLGFLPGDLFEKVNPYLRPLYDALHDMMDFEKASRLISRGVIEVAPLAFMRGRTINDSFVILDEAQNTTSEQMKMFLTRLGFSSKAVITGDITQIDLPGGKVSGLVEARDILNGVRGIGFVYFSEKDVVRHRLVREIIKAYDSSASRKQAQPKNGAGESE
ncbi:MAG: PhoH family protein [Thermodesulfobacteriota bacterium]|nr:PhoH family protein [Thermodesulfobacteriota bacterium]